MDKAHETPQEVLQRGGAIRYESCWFLIGGQWNGGQEDWMKEWPYNWRGGQFAGMHFDRERLIKELEEGTKMPIEQLLEEGKYQLVQGWAAIEVPREEDRPDYGHEPFVKDYEERIGVISYDLPKK